MEVVAVVAVGRMQWPATVLRNTAWCVLQSFPNSCCSNGVCARKEDVFCRGREQSQGHGREKRTECIYCNEGVGDGDGEVVCPSGGISKAGKARKHARNFHPAESSLITPKQGAGPCRPGIPPSPPGHSGRCALLAPVLQDLRESADPCDV